LVLVKEIVSREILVHDFHVDCSSVVTRCGLSRQPKSEILSTRKCLFYAWNFESDAIPLPKIVKLCPLEESPAMGGVDE
jgi:hypothetical protein